MMDFKLRKHNVIAASFMKNTEKEKKRNVEVSVEGGILIPKDFENSRYLAVQLKIHFGNPEEHLYLTLETLSTFEIDKARGTSEIREEKIQAVCLPVALTELRKTVKKVTEAYGISGLDLPPFEEEIVEN